MLNAKEKKELSLSFNKEVWSPENMQEPLIMATAVIDILTAVYGQHNLTDSVQNLSKQIECGWVKPWIKVDTNTNRPLACAALIDHGAQVEIGRAANHPQNGGSGGGKLMEQACRWHIERDDRPLVAEVRMAQKFKGIEGGQGSQHVLLSKLNFIPHAFVPAFHHPGLMGVDRQELFCFATLPPIHLKWKREVIHNAVHVTLPNNTFNRVGKEAHFLLWGQTGGWQNIIPIEAVIHNFTLPGFKPIFQKEKTKVLVEFNGIFHDIKVNCEKGIHIEDAWNMLSKDPSFRFALAEVEQQTEKDMWAQKDLEKAGAIFLGFTFCPERIKSLWGILSKNVILAPSECANSFSEELITFVKKTETCLIKNRIA